MRTLMRQRKKKNVTNEQLYIKDIIKYKEYFFNV